MLSIRADMWGQQMWGDTPIVRTLLVSLFALGWGNVSPVAASPQNGQGQKVEVDSEDIFGFTSGTDLPELGQKAAEIEIVGRFGKQDGSYFALIPSLAFKYMAFPDTQLAVSVAAARHDISGVTGLDDRRQ